MKKLRKRLMSWLMIVAFVFSTFAPFMPMTVHAALPELQNVKISSDGILSWDAFPGATTYVLSVNKSGYFAGGKYVTGTTVNIKEYLETNGVDSGTFNVQLFAMDKKSIDGGVVISETWEGTYIYTSILPKLSTPTNIQWSGNTLSWDAVPYAEKYHVFLLGGEKTFDFDITKTSIDFTPYLDHGTKTYKAHIISKASGYTYSEYYTESVTLTRILPELQNVKISSDGILSWDAFSGATTYVLSVNKSGHFAGGGYVTGTTVNIKEYLETNGVDSGTFNVQLFAMDKKSIDGGVVISKTWEGTYTYVKEVAPTQYTVTYDFNGGTPGSISSSFQVNDGEKIDFDYLKFQINNYVTAPTGKEFYNFAIDGNAWNSGEYTVTKPITLKVQWNFIPSTPKHAITFDFNGGTSSLSVSPVNEGSKLKFDTYKKIVELNVTPPDDNKVFDAFEIGGTRWDSGEYEVTTPITLKILWKEKVIRTVTFINGIDSSTISTATVNDGEKVTRPTTDPTMTNYTFDNWYSDAGMTTLFDFDTPITAHTPIYAKFIPNSVTPTYVIESGANQTYTIDSNVDVVIKASGTKANLSKIQIDGTDLDTANYTTEEGSTILTLKASYLNTLSEGDHTVKFVYNDGDVSTNLKVVKNTTGGNTGGNTDPSTPTDPSGTNTGGNTGTNTNNNTSSPQTSDNIVFYIMTMLLSLFGIAGASVYVNRKKLFNR